MKKSYIKIEFERYVAINKEPYYLFSSKELFKEPFLVSCLDYPKTIEELMPDQNLSICIKGVDKLDNKCLLTNIEWQS